MSLINDLFQQPIDEGYAEAAARRAAAGDDSSSGGRPRRSVALMFGLLGLGLLLTVATLQVRHDAGVVSAERASLAEQIRETSERTSALEDQVASLQSTVLAMESEALRNLDVSNELRRNMSAAQAVVGTSRVTGPGIVIEINDAEPGAVMSPDCSATNVLDYDLQQIINGLWAVGAEAVSVGNERITPLTAIRSVDNVILVNIRPQGPPYVVRAIGDPQALEVDFVDGPGGNWLRSIYLDCGIQSTITAEPSLTLPGGSASLQVAETLTR
jgi:uncharacterized protein YlxW (UPF0749 family)